VKGLVVYCADVGSVKRNFGWARVNADGAEMTRGGHEIGALAAAVAADLNAGRPTALGFECPLWAPLPEQADELGAARPGECEDGVNRPWSAGPGAAVLTTGVAQVPWLLERVRASAAGQDAHLDWEKFAAAGAGLFLWEAFVSGGAKAWETDAVGDEGEHEFDARLGAETFCAALPDPRDANAVVSAGGVISLIGAAILRSGWSGDLSLLGETCLVVKAKA
jgi:hypothetical protein